METGYDPARIRELSLRTLAAVDAVRAVRSTDPLAREALRALRLARQNLEDVWIPAVQAIERSEALVTWRTVRLPAVDPMGWRRLVPGALPTHLRPPTTTALAGLSDEELLGRLQWTDRVLADPTGARRGPVGQSAIPAAALDELAAELALRVRHDPRFADRLAATASTTPLVGHLVGRGAFSAPFVTRVVTAMMWPHGPQTTADLDGYARSLSGALEALVDDPVACLDLLLDPALLYGLAAWERLDAAVVADVVMSGLYRSVATDPARLADGYRVLTRLVELAGGPLDQGFQPGVARGVAASLAGYVETLAPAIGTTGEGPVVVSDERVGLGIDLGTYDQVAALVGAVLRDGDAAARLGVVTAAYTDHVLTDLGPEVLVLPGLASAVAFTRLVEDAATAEQSQLVQEAAAEAGRRRRLGDAIGFGLAATLTASGLGATARAGVSQIVRMATDVLARVEPGRLPEGSIGAQVHMQVTVTTVAMAVADPAVLRSSSGAAPLTRSEAAGLSRRLREIERCDDPGERARLVSRLEQHIDQRIPRLGGHLDAVRAHGQLDQLR